MPARDFRCWARSDSWLESLAKLASTIEAGGRPVLSAAAAAAAVN